MLEVKDVKVANLADCARLCLGTSLPPGVDSHAAVDLQRRKVGLLRQHSMAGAGAKAAYRDGTLVGSMDWYPVEVSPTPVAGRDLFVINCVRVAEPAARSEILGAMLRSAEAAWSKRAGVAVVARKKGWEEFGWEAVARRRPPEDAHGEQQVLFLKRNAPDAAAAFVPAFKDFKLEPGKLRVDLVESDHCPWNGYVFDMVRRVVASYGKPVQLVEVDGRKRAAVEKYGVSAGIAVNGVFKPLLRPHFLPDERSVRRMLDEA